LLFWRHLYDVIDKYLAKSRTDIQVITWISKDICSLMKQSKFFFSVELYLLKFWHLRIDAVVPMTTRLSRSGHTCCLPALVQCHGIETAVLARASRFSSLTTLVFQRLFQVRLGPRRSPVQKRLGIAGARFFTGQILIVTLGECAFYELAKWPASNNVFTDDTGTY